MVPERESSSSNSEPERLISKKELLEAAGITSRKLTYWQDEGIISRPVLYKGQGGKSFYDGTHLLATYDLNFLQNECRQSIRDIKQIIQRVREDLPNFTITDNPAFCLSTFLDCSTHSYLKNNPEIIDQFKKGNKVLVANGKDILLIDIDRCQKSYIDRNGNILKIIREDEFDPLWFIQAEPIDKFAEGVLDTSFESEYDQSPEIYSQFDSRFKLLVKLFRNSVMLPPAYYYDGKEYYSELDISAGGFLVSFAQEHGFEKAASLVERIKEDIAAFFCFPSESKEYSDFFLRFKRDVELIRRAILELYDIRKYGPNDCCTECGKAFFDRFLEHQIRMKPNYIDNTIMFQRDVAQYPATQINGTDLSQK